MDIQKLRLSQVDSAVKQASVPSRPSIGWIQTIRTALGMTTRQLAARIGVTQSTLAELEKSEAADKITLHSLRRAADAMDCDLQYVLVPRSSLKKRVENQAEAIARQRVSRVFHTMQLEDQAPTQKVDKKEISRMQTSLLATNWKHLWE
ncbi:helix-turn-helix family protein [Collimonas fungivorans]|uniref:Helix-turn-helix family protein n=1 Tax=Collimonas fungivorans TaxID=158899 RepID=A0A127P509_9BURK|nr:mobile mystery protein A [Collimonas fungivorans]AMO92754.1 helix-turn-helix family protein [Collimonas fungivorans]